MIKLPILKGDKVMKPGQAITASFHPPKNQYSEDTVATVISDPFVFKDKTYVVVDIDNKTIVDKLTNMRVECVESLYKLPVKEYRAIFRSELGTISEGLTPTTIPITRKEYPDMVARSVFIDGIFSHIEPLE